MAKQGSDWEEFENTIIDAVDIKSVCESWGIQFTGHISDAGWMACSAVDREDRNESAGVNINTGVYHDFAGGPAISLFTLGMKTGQYSSYMECVNDLAKQHKLLSKKPKDRKGASFFEKIRLKTWKDSQVLGLCTNLKIKPETLRMVGCSIGVAQLDDVVVVFPVANAEDFERRQTGNVIRNSNGGMLEHYKGKGRPSEMKRSLHHGTAGIVNQFAIQNWRTAKMVWKVEGISDMLALQEHIPEERRKIDVVITNSDGADSAHTVRKVAPQMRGKRVAVIHDHDQPGQFGSGSRQLGGAKRWVNECSVFADAVANVTLFPGEPLAEKKGKDLRDWFEAGNTYEDLMELARGADWIMKQSADRIEREEEDGLLPHQMLLKQLSLIVVGHFKTGVIRVFSGVKVRNFDIRDLDRFTFLSLLTHVGPHCQEFVANPDDDRPDENLATINQVRHAIALEASEREIQPGGSRGIGIWESGGRALAIGVGEWIAVNGGIEVMTTPWVDDKVVEFGGDTEQWYDHEVLIEALDSAESPAWCQAHFRELEDWFGDCSNVQHPKANTMLTCMALACWGQSIWDWTPWVGVTGQSGCGKTTLRNKLADYFGPLALSVSNATEAGIRNTIKTNSRILLLDEFENSRQRVQILNMLMGSGRAGGTSLRSNASQGSVTTEYKLLPWLFATELREDKETEANRYVKLEMTPFRGQKDDIQSTKAEAERLRNLSIAVVMRNWKRIRYLQTYCSNIMRKADGSVWRVNESYALATAVYGAIHGLSDDECGKWHQDLMADLREYSELEEDEPEHVTLMHVIFSSMVQVGAGKTESVTALLNKGLADAYTCDAEKLLANVGLVKLSQEKVQSLKAWKKGREAGKTLDTEYVFIATGENAQVRRTLLKDVNLKHLNLKQMLSRVDYSFKSKQRVGGIAVNGVCVPKPEMREDGEASEDDAFIDPDLIGV